MRVTKYTFPVDPCLFNPLQMHPRAVLFHSINGFARWLHEHWVPYTELTSVHHTAVAIVGIHLTYVKPFDFFETAVLHVTAGVRARKRGRLLQLDMEFASARESLIKLTVIMRTIIVEDHVSLAGAPGTISETLLARLADDEIDSDGPDRIVASRVQAIESAGTVVAEAEVPSFVSRILCEAADQWSFTEVNSFLTPARETLVRAHGERVQLLRQTMTRPIKTLDVEFRRALFVFDEARTVTRAHLSNGTVGFVHRILPGRSGDNNPCVLALETFF